MGKDQTVGLDVLRRLGRSGAIVRAIALARKASSSAAAGLISASGVALVLAVPAAAQFQSEGYRFLEAVKDREGDKVTDMLNKPGSQIVNTRDITSGDTGLHIVIARNDEVWTRFLLQRGADPNIRNKKGVTPLQLATALGFVEGADALIKGGANVNVADQTGETPLIAAVHARNLALVRLLLSKGADPDRNDNSGRSARNYMELQTGNAMLKQEFEAADKKRAESAGTKKDYGPSF
jgi:ankyrin repeat protein